MYHSKIIIIDQKSPLTIIEDKKYIYFVSKRFKKLPAAKDKINIILKNTTLFLKKFRIFVLFIIFSVMFANVFAELVLSNEKIKASTTTPFAEKKKYWA